ncbi:MAG: Leucyl-tRNA synthetase [Candidatus Woesebacteria bacterium GW2011_GWA1_39_21b]|uniref:Leucine--tRNA ligase n=1 Tax=Candidatus Woesebacteria bacterium GW2011_GWA1_39_21b TaxID=1618551 RepID=A0A0G0RJC7_9BACT|nr:MAG: Leucyl-tRNA synthetase [Candidatus Woesebacteria bacterium GW2011_GWA1_39_21b]KKS77218.1 MAG: Leucyl-tRNA synthetase [Parcubacteria group bacterium GW2011_GWB1_42_9]KKS89792.1 MAG: Leucyl-tRNA synthetase [Parcubacteria group bacterium GW2011_GWC1_43_11b]
MKKGDKKTSSETIKYDHLKIEKKWQKEWNKNNLYKTNEKSKSPKSYVLDMFPYPSGEGLHVGHVEGYTATDIYSRYQRMNGFSVLHPMGWDAFGLPAENYAIKNKVNPAVSTKKNIDNFRRQLKMIGFSYDWDREINTTDPEYYRWTQWIFLQLYKKGLAYESYEPINWCPSCQTGLANEDLEDGKCERCGSEVEKKPMRQWVLRITDYADRLLSDLDDLTWPESVKESQRNWIGRSEGAEIDFAIAKKRHFVIVHGFKSNSCKDFFPWLKNELEKLGHQVTVLDLPNPYLPNLEEQVNHVLNNAKFDQDTVLIGHSLGTVVSMKLLERLKTPIARTVLVSGLIEPDVKDKNEASALKLFSNWEFNLKTIKANAGEIKILRDINDPVIGDKQGKAIKNKLGGELIEFEAEKPHTCGRVEPVVLDHCLDRLKVFTTRPDTLFGATYMVVAPEHKLIEKFAQDIKNLAEVKKYVVQANKKSELERSAEGKDKTGVVLEGLRAINPANGEEIPIFVADYVLPDYGFGAIMAVPAHDERDFAFAQKFDLPIREVIRPLIKNLKGPDAVKDGVPFFHRDAIVAVVKHWSEDKYLCLKWKKIDWRGFVIGGIEKGEDEISAAIREIQEETGYQNPKFIKKLGGVIDSQFYHVIKKENRWAHFQGLYFELTSSEHKEISKKEQEIHDVLWLSPKEVDEFLNVDDMPIFWQRVFNDDSCYAGRGVLVNSGIFDNLDTIRAKKQITKFVRGKLVTKYKLRDWVFSRQRYWGEPIPIIHCQKCGVTPVLEKDLPVELPKVKSYAPTGTGESPLADIASWVKTKCPACGGPAKRETNTMPQWAGSSWYYLRFLDPKNKKALADKKMLEDWLPVSMYVGGVEHATRHLIYARFWHKFLYDIDIVSEAEPFQQLKNQGLILGEDSRKMSKRWGNVINPDDMVKLYGADTLRLYEMFMGPFEMSKSWKTENMIGCRRFLERTSRVMEKVSATARDPHLESELHKTIKKVSEDIKAFSFNTAISTMMIFTNHLEKATTIPQAVMVEYLKVLAPFAPHLSEELWFRLGQKKSVHLASWPKFDLTKIQSDKVLIVIQINGRVRDSFELIGDLNTEEAVKKIALDRATVLHWTKDKKISRIVYVPNKLINIVTN